MGDNYLDMHRLFAGLHAESRWDWSRSHPVIRISFSDGVLHSAERLQQRILDNLRQNAERLGVSFPPGLDLPGQFGELIRQARARHGQRAVVLVDEYDKPMLDNITEPEIARQMRDGLRDFYSVIKGQDAHIKFAMLTGVSKFSKVSLFSGLNNLIDITVDARYSDICGYTDLDVDTVFAPELFDLDRDQISLNKALLPRLGVSGSQALIQRLQLLKLLRARDFDGLKALFSAFFAGIPNDWYRSNPIAQYEGYYASVFYSHFAALGLDIRLEDVTNHDRIDMSVLFDGQVWLPARQARPVWP